MGEIQGPVLVATVGTGTAEDFQSTVSKPFGRSFRAGQWGRILLVASRKTEENARRLVEQFREMPIEVRVLRNAGDEENPDECFEQFDRILEALLEDGVESEKVVVDFTRGTKAMSAGVVLAGVRREVGRLRYLGGAQRDERGMVIPGTEKVFDVRPGKILESQELTRGIELLRAGQYGAVARLYPGYPQVKPAGRLKTDVLCLQALAAFWGAWDAFDYETAHSLSCFGDLPARRPSWSRELFPSEQQRAMLERLKGKEPGERKAGERAGACRDLAADLLANAGRRLGEGQTEEAFVRAYRVLEMLGQIRLFAHGYDSARIDPEDGRVRQWLRELPEDERPRRSRFKGRLELGREKAAQFLKFLGDPFADALNDLWWVGALNPVNRNVSILMHGYKARSRRKDGLMPELLKRMEQKFVEEDVGNAERLESCRFHFLQ